MTISTEDLTRMADGRHVFGHKDGLALAAELLAARAKIEAAEKLARMLAMAQLWLDVDGRFDMQGINAALAAWEAAQ